MSADWVSVSKAEALGARSSQQDCAAHVLLPPEASGPDRVLVVLADGMGGHAAGDVASQTAVNAFIAETQHCKMAPASEVLQRGLSAAASAVQTAASNDPALKDMGTTLVAGIIEHVAETVILRWVSVGDSPLWRAHANGSLERLNADHSLAGQLDEEVRAGRITSAEAKRDPRRQQANVLTLALMAGPLDQSRADLRILPLALSEGDVLVFSSDGAESLPTNKISKALRRHQAGGASRMAQGLVRAVTDHKLPQQDNVMVVVVDPRKKHKRGLFG